VLAGFLSGAISCLMQLRHEMQIMRRFSEYASQFKYNKVLETSNLSLTISRSESRKEQLLEGKQGEAAPTNECSDH